MLEFTELLIKDNKLSIKLNIKEETYYENWYIESVFYNTQDTFTGVKNSNSVLLFDAANKRELSLELPLKSNIVNSLFFITATSHLIGMPVEEIPCGKDNTKIVGVAVNGCYLVNRAMQYIKELNSNCDIPKNLIDEILRQKALEIAIKGNHLLEAADLYEKYFKSDESVIINNNCGCNG